MQLMFKKRRGKMAYRDKVLTIESANLVGYWPLNETSGTTADNYEGTAGRDGTYSANVSTIGTTTGIGDGNTAPAFNGSYGVQLPNTALNTPFSGAEGSLSVWAKVSGAAVWTDGDAGYILDIGVNSNNWVLFRKNGAGNQLLAQYKAGGTTESQSEALTPTDWFHLGMTWSKTADTVTYYYAGSAWGSADTGLGTFSGTLVGNFCQIAQYAGSERWEGAIAHVALWNTPLSAANMLSLATV